MIFQRYQKEIEKELRSIIGTGSSPFYQMMRYHLGWIDEQGNPQEETSGKLLRPTLCLLACETVGGNWKAALPAAAVLELVHNYSLIHDDIEDQSQFRRQRRTVWSIWDEAQAINVGDGMYALSRLALLRLSSRGFTPEKILSVIHLLDEACLKLCEGQYLDISYEDRTDIGMEDYLEMIGSKTAALISCSLKIGASLSTDNDQLCEGIGQFGWKLGLAFQITDDLLGIWGDEKTTGKSNSDIYQKKKSLPVVYALKEASGGDREKLLHIYSKKVIENNDAAEVLNILDRIGAHGYTQEMAKRYHKEALAILEATDLTLQDQKQLREMASFLIEREY